MEALWLGTEVTGTALVVALTISVVVTLTIAVATVPFVGTLDVTIEANDR